MFYEVIPLAAQRAGMKDLNWIDKASHANFLRYVRAAYSEFSPAERPALLPTLQPWADRVDGHAILDSFIADRPLPLRLNNIIDHGKKIVRPFAQKLQAALRQH